MTQRQVQVVKKGSRPAPAPGTPGNPITSTPSGRPLPY
jgi:hypothetical protein